MKTPLQRQKPLTKLLCQNCDVMSQIRYRTGAYNGKMHAMLEAESNTTPWKVLLWYQKQKVGSTFALSYVPFVPFVPFLVLLLSH